MRKRILSLGLVFSLLLAVPMTASAETLTNDTDWKVTFDGSQMQSNFKSREIDELLLGMEPGDSTEITIKLENKQNESTEWYMLNEVLESMEDSSKVASGGAYEYQLLYLPPNGGAVETLFDSTDIGGESTAGGVGLKQATQATDDENDEWFHLTSLAANQTGAVQLTVKLEGETIGNRYQDTLAKTQMQFAAENSVTKKNVTENKTVKRKPTRRVKTVKTGDYSSISLYVSLAAFALGLILLLIVFKRMREREEEQVVTVENRQSRTHRREDR